MDNQITQLEKAKSFMEGFPAWAIVIDREKLIYNANPVARQMGLTEGKYCYKTLGQTKPCPWCNTIRCLDEQRFMSLTVRVEYTPTGARKVEQGGVRVDAHQIPLTPELCLHFGFIGLLPENERRTCCQRRGLLSCGGDAGGAGGVNRAGHGRDPVEQLQSHGCGQGGAWYSVQ